MRCAEIGLRASPCAGAASRPLGFSGSRHWSLRDIPAKAGAGGEGEGRDGGEEGRGRSRAQGDGIRASGGERNPRAPPRLSRERPAGPAPSPASPSPCGRSGAGVAVHRPPGAGSRRGSLREPSHGRPPWGPRRPWVPPHAPSLRAPAWVSARPEGAARGGERETPRLPPSGAGGLRPPDAPRPPSPTPRGVSPSRPGPRCLNAPPPIPPRGVPGRARRGPAGSPCPAAAAHRVLRPHLRPWRGRRRGERAAQLLPPPSDRLRFRRRLGFPGAAAAG